MGRGFSLGAATYREPLGEPLASKKSIWRIRQQKLKGKGGKAGPWL